MKPNQFNPRLTEQEVASIRQKCPTCGSWLLNAKEAAFKFKTALSYVYNLRGNYSRKPKEIRH